MVFGGDGIVLPGGSYVTTTRTVLNGIGIVGAVSAGFKIGDTIVNGIHFGYEMATGESLAHDAGHWLYNNSRLLKGKSYLFASKVKKLNKSQQASFWMIYLGFCVFETLWLYERGTFEEITSFGGSVILLISFLATGFFLYKYVAANPDKFE
ncbi:MAG: hypothetical protein RL839_04560 [Gammaproteobacteria bacterium]